MKIYVGNLSFNTTEADLRKAFEQHGPVASAEIVMDRSTNQSRGFGFVEMPDSAQAKAAIEALNGSVQDGRTLRVNEARARTEGPPRRDNTRRY